MANLLCPCGAILSNGTIPNPIEHWLLSSDMDPADGEDADGFRERICEVSPNVWRCPTCKRVAVFEPGENDATWYEVRTAERATPACIHSVNQLGHCTRCGERPNDRATPTCDNPECGRVDVARGTPNH